MSLVVGLGQPQEPTALPLLLVGGSTAPKIKDGEEQEKAEQTCKARASLVDSVDYRVLQQFVSADTPSDSKDDDSESKDKVTGKV